MDRDNKIDQNIWNKDLCLLENNKQFLVYNIKIFINQYKELSYIPTRQWSIKSPGLLQFDLGLLQFSKIL